MSRYSEKKARLDLIVECQTRARWLRGKLAALQCVGALPFVTETRDTSPGAQQFDRLAEALDVVNAELDDLARREA
jgi:hypothetical protein